MTKAAAAAYRSPSSPSRCSPTPPTTRAGPGRAKTYRQASASRVLTLEYLDGVSLSNLEAVKQYFPEPEVALIASLNTWVGSVLQNDWFHADVHAGTPARNSAQFGAVH